jgi:hypothetical protein
MGYDEPRWAKALDYHQQSTDDALELFKWLRGNTYKLIKNQPDAVWSNTIEHSENGTMTLEDWLKTYDDHVPAHVAQMRDPSCPTQVRRPSRSARYRCSTRSVKICRTRR